MAIKFECDNCKKIASNDTDGTKFPYLTVTLGGRSATGHFCSRCAGQMTPEALLALLIQSVRIEHGFESPADNAGAAGATERETKAC
jgi:hypothetical protein